MLLLCMKFIRSNWSNYFKMLMFNGWNFNDFWRYCLGVCNDSGLFFFCIFVFSEVNFIFGVVCV